MKLTIAQLQEALVLEYKKISCVKYINMGGCMYAALAVYRSMKEKFQNQEHFNSLHLVIEDYPTHHKYTRKYINELITLKRTNIFPIVSNHYGLSFFKGSLVDTTGVCKYDKLSKISIVNHEFIEKYAREVLSIDSWNEVFIPRLSIKEINTKLNLKHKIRNVSRTTICLETYSRYKTLNTIKFIISPNYTIKQYNKHKYNKAVKV